MALCGCSRAVSPAGRARSPVQGRLHPDGRFTAAAAEVSFQLPQTHVLSDCHLGRCNEARTRSWLQVAQLCPRIHVLEHLQPLLFRLTEERMGCTHHRTHLQTLTHVVLKRPGEPSKTGTLSPFTRCAASAEGYHAFKCHGPCRRCWVCHYRCHACLAAHAHPNRHCDHAASNVRRPPGPPRLPRTVVQQHRQH